jgi:para-nitrobenzyl esterase
VEGYRDARAGRRPIEPAELWFALESDRYFRLPAIRLAESQARRGLPCWKYLFTWPSPALGGAVGSCHALEIPFVFGLDEASPVAAFVGSGPAARALSERMQDAWLAFAREGRPEAPGLPAWPEYDTATRATMLLGVECGMEADPLAAERRLWDGLV